MQGSIFDIKRYSVHDGPGIRTTVFLQGCSLDCAWCHNPESRPERPPTAFREERCLACGACAEACPQPEKPRPDSPWPPGCLRCGSCLAVCPTEARELAGRLVTADEVLRTLERDRLFFDESGGGATFSGGEPLAQAAFLETLLAGCRQRGIATAVDTTGHAPPEVVARLAPLVDLWLYDLKHPDPERHAQLTGVGNEWVLANLRWLGEHGARIWARVPVIPGYNDDTATVMAAGRILARVPGVEHVNLLPYHQAAAAKRERFGLGEAPDLDPPDRQPLLRLAHNLTGLGLTVHIGG